MQFLFTPVFFLCLVFSAFAAPIPGNGTALNSSVTASPPPAKSPVVEVTEIPQESDQIVLDFISSQEDGSFSPIRIDFTEDRRQNAYHSGNPSSIVHPVAPFHQKRGRIWILTFVLSYLTNTYPSKPP
ncbi:hypothetical protein EV361DRAFT_1032051 [Lentinula raphanica]|uniref:Uncharacterized protein n=1 Tax=Lentinula raphanica TaxID=153919 RepID=A0AA38P9J1_9AGAR|nr:hypothetical protein F5880DRAFT_1504219 [Lentinula raphanica]KAJ3838536.1 hypothetical protein F5878DRAFT_681904 [Lentinula raphanica]KAJ3973970.1 hypothetical protein EV361DRAFT_1032051 [Lentinula raphanica]